MKLAYNVKDKPSFPKLIAFAFQQLLAILAATIVVPLIINDNVANLIKDGNLPEGFLAGMEMQQSAALLGAGVGTLVYLLFTKFKSPVFLGSSFAFLGSMTAAFAGATCAQKGFAGLIIGAVLAGLVYVVIAVVVKFAGAKWVDKLMPKQVIGPTVAIIGLSLAANAVSDLQSGKWSKTVEVADKFEQVIENGAIVDVPVTKTLAANPLICVLVGIITLLVVMICSVYAKKTLKAIPFIIGIAAGYAVAALFTVIGIKTDNPDLMIIDFSIFKEMGSFVSVPTFTFMNAFKDDGFKSALNDSSYLLSVALAYVPVAFVVFAEHIADHKNISSIIETDLLEEPGLHRTLLGDGVGSMFGAFFGGCPNTTYGESVGCVAISGNASVITILVTAFICIALAFVTPFVTALSSIPSCVMGGVCMALYGFIAVSGLKMVQKVDLEDNRNLFVISVILIAGIGGLTLTFGNVEAGKTVKITAIATALILGIITNLVLGAKGEKKAK